MPRRRATSNPARRRAPLGLALALLLALVLALPATPRAQPASFAPLIKAHRGSVVHINTRSNTVVARKPRALRPFRDPDSGLGMGSGFIVRADGHVVTSYHVIEDAAEVEVLLEDGRAFPATVVGTDPQTDLALLRIGAQDLPALVFGDSDAVEVGDWLLAIGNPLGLDYSATVGILSARGRNIFEEENLAYGDFLQTDAAINPGNSGGPLFNLAGEVIGVSSAVSRNGQGIGFAVPSNIARPIVQQLLETGRVVKGWLGVVILELSPARRAELGLPPQARGVLVEEVVAQGPAAQGGLRGGDLLTAFAQAPLRTVAQVQRLVALSVPGLEVQVQVLRLEAPGGSWQPLSVNLTLGQAPDPALAGGATPLERAGLDIIALPDPLRAQVGLRGGVLVQGVLPDSPAARTGLQPGDVIVEADREVLHSTTELSRVLRERDGEKLPLLVHRGQTVLYLVYSPGPESRCFGSGC